MKMHAGYLNLLGRLVILSVMLSGCNIGDDAQIGNGAATNSVPVMAAQLKLALNPTKIFNFTWDDVADATYYRILEDPDGQSGFKQISGDILTGVGSFSLPLNVPLYERFNARFVLQSCNSRGCVNGDAFNISGSMAGAIGYIKTSTVSTFQLFGWDVDINAAGDVMAISATADGGTGAVYIFTRNSDNNWIESARLTADNAESGDVFGRAIALSADGNTLAVGATGEASNSQANASNNSLNDAGAVYVFERTGAGGNWNQTAYLKANYINESAWFGVSVSLSQDGSALAVGAFMENSNSQGINSTPVPTNIGDNYGAAYVFSRINGLWSATPTYIKASDGQLDAEFGISVSLSGDGKMLVVGASYMDDGFVDSGAVYQYSKDMSGTWNEIQKIRPKAIEFARSNLIDAQSADEQFGSAVRLSRDGSTLAVTALWNSVPVTGINVYAPNAATSLGVYVPLTATVLSDGSSAVYVFNLNQGGWEQQAFIKPNVLRGNGIFGTALALSANGDKLVVGNPWEQSISTGINQNEDNSSLKNGATFVFSRINSTSWVQSAYLKSPLFKVGQNAGGSVALDDSATTVVSGAYYENGVNPGINPQYLEDGSANDSGAVYLY